jgi:two-component system response regulator (stage 0 sporulation protein F)
VDIKDYLTITEVSTYLKLPEETVYKYARSGKIPASKVGRYWRFERNQIDRWVDQNSNRGNRDLHIMVVDDDQGILALSKRWIESSGASIDCLSNGEDAIARLKVQQYGLIFLDLVLPNMNGVDALKQIREIAPDTEVVIITAFFESHLMERVMDLGPITVLKKPLDKEAMLDLVERRATVVAS